MIVELFLIMALMVVMGSFCASFAAVNTTMDFNASGTAATVNIAARSGMSVSVLDILAYSDLSTSEIAIYQGAAAGTTTNYTQIHTLDCGDATKQYSATEKRHLYKLPKGYQARLVVDSTTRNALAVNWTYDENLP